MIDVLWISLIGAGSVLAGLVVLWILMYFLVRATSPKKKEKKEDTHGVTSDLDKNDELRYKQKAAAASVAVSIALLHTSFSSTRRQCDQEISSWQIAHRNQQIMNKVKFTGGDRYSK